MSNRSYQTQMPSDVDRDSVAPRTLPGPGIPLDLSRPWVLFGGSGFIGQHLAGRLLGLGLRVIIADLEPASSPVGEFHFCDVRDPIPLDFPGAVIVNLAAIHRTPGHEICEYYETNVAGASQALAWATAMNSPLVVFISSIAVYGPSESEKTESAAPRPNGPYGHSKWLAERLHATWHATADGARLIVARPGVVFGPGERGNFTRLAQALLRNRFYFPGRRDTIKACIYVDDLIDSILFTVRAHAGSSVTFNACYPEQPTLEDICAAFSDTASISPPLEIPAILISLLRAALGYLPSQRLSVLNDRIHKLQTSSYIRPAELTRLGFSWNRDLRGGIAAWHTASRGTFK